MAMELTLSVQGVVNRYERSLRSVRGLFDLYPVPRPQGAPQAKYRPLPPAIVQGVTAGFESFAEDLVVVAMIKGAASSWAQVGAHADMTNPTVKELAEKLQSACGLSITAPKGWSVKLWRQSGAKKTAWSATKAVGWSDLMTQSDSWMQVRHCLTHGLVTGTSPAEWPGPVSKKAFRNQSALPAAMDVLAEASSGPKRSLTMYPAINCCLVYTEGAIVIAEEVASKLGEVVNTDALRKFGDI